MRRTLALLLAAALLAGCGGGGAGGIQADAPGTTLACVPAPGSATTVSVKEAPFGALGNGVSDDTAAIQAAVDAIAGTGGTVTVPAGTYLVNAQASIRLGSSMTLQLAEGAVLKAIPTSAGSYCVVKVYGVSQVVIRGGTLQGDYGTPATHTGSSGEWGMGLSVQGSSQVTVAGVLARDCWGDGFNVGAGASGVTLCSVRAEHNRRNGLAITDADTVVVRDSAFVGTGGTLPEAGLDIEPNAGESVSRVTITGCSFTGNLGDGIADGVPLAHTGSAFITQVTLAGNRITGNGASTLDSAGRSGIELSNASGHQITGNTVSGNTGNGILLRDAATGMTVTGNRVQNNSGHGLWDLVGGNVISGNTVTGNGLSP